MGKSKEKLFLQPYLKLFQEEADYWFRYFGLLDFDLKVKISTSDEMENLAEATCDHIAKHATIVIAKFWPEYYFNDMDYEVRLTAFHEVCEILFGRIRALADRFSDMEVNETIHSIINRLQNSIFIESLESRKKKKV